jgi:uncharacterized membrane protein YeaQ/YmgE (transglycosylase-associated protein family)
MIGMDFVSFLILLVISVVVALIVHYGLRVRVRTGFISFLGSVVWGRVGAWLGSPVFGHWAFNYEEVYIIPAILGSFALLVLMVDLVKTMKTPA